MKAYKRIETILNSLNDRSNQKVSLRNETWELKGTNSPYVSHQKVVLSAGHGVERLIVFGDNELFVYAYDTRIDTDDLMVRVLPAFHFDRFFKFPVSKPDWLNGNVNVAYPDRFSGYVDGKPTFNKDVVVNLLDMKYEEYEE